jgi:primosomal protein N' (replication factor Y)
MLYPPFSDICVIGFVGASEAKVQKASHAFLSLLSLFARDNYPEQPLRVLKPSPAVIGKVSNKYRYKLIIKCRNSLKFREMISKLLVQFTGDRNFSSVTVYADINPDSIN